MDIPETSVKKSRPTRYVVICDDILIELMNFMDRRCLTIMELSCRRLRYFSTKYHQIRPLLVLDGLTCRYGTSDGYWKKGSLGDELVPRGTMDPFPCLDTNPVPFRSNFSGIQIHYNEHVDRQSVLFTTEAEIPIVPEYLRIKRWYLGFPATDVKEGWYTEHKQRWPDWNQLVRYREYERVTLLHLPLMLRMIRASSEARLDMVIRHNTFLHSFQARNYFDTQLKPILDRISTLSVTIHDPEPLLEFVLLIRKVCTPTIYCTGYSHFLARSVDMKGFADWANIMSFGEHRKAIITVSHYTDQAEAVIGTEIMTKNLLRLNNKLVESFRSSYNAQSYELIFKIYTSYQIAGLTQHAEVHVNKETNERYTFNIFPQTRGFTLLAAFVRQHYKKPVKTNQTPILQLTELTGKLDDPDPFPDTIDEIHSDDFRSKLGPYEATVTLPATNSGHPQVPL